jgi:hemoglobin-like flavoprotein
MRSKCPLPQCGGVTPEQIVLVQETFAQVVPIADTAAVLFYGRLFEMDPDLRALFRADMSAQYSNLMQTLTVVVRGLDRLDSILPAVQALGRRHAGYGVKDQHFDLVGEALLWTLQQGLGSAFTPEVRQAWATAYGLLASTMRDSLSPASLPAAA